MDSERRLAGRLALPDPRGPLQLRKRTGVVATASPLTVYVGGSTTASPCVSLGDYWPVVGDHVVLLEDGPDLFILDALESGAWHAYTPTIRSNASGITIGTGGSVTGFYRRRAATVDWRAQVFFGTGLSFPAGQFAITLPFDAVLTGRYMDVGRCIIYDASAIAGGFRPRSWDVHRLDAAVDCSVQDRSTNNYVTDTIPWTWAAGDYMVFSGAYEAA